MLKKICSIITFLFNHPLTKQHKLKTIFRFLQWQIWSRLSRKKIIIPWVDNSKLLVSVGETAVTGNLYVGLSEYEDMLFLLHSLQSHETFVDVGANVGTYTILASKVVGCRSISFEPIPTTYKKLIEQIKINQISHLVKPDNRGIGSQIGKLFFTQNYGTMNKVSTTGKNHEISITKVTTLDLELNSHKSYFFKIDVEGYEYQVIEGGKKILSSPNVSALIVELNGSGEEFGYSNDLVHNKIISLNFLPVQYDPIRRKITVLDSYNKNGGNTIYIKDERLISSRCELAKKRRIHRVGDFYI